MARRLYALEGLMKTGTRAIAALALTVAAAAGGCAPAVQGGRTADRDIESITLTVQNHNWSDVNVYARDGDMRYRLGTVPSFTERRFTIPAAVAFGRTNLRLEADPIGGAQRHITPGILAWPGDEIDWQIENHMAFSSFRVHTMR